MMNQLSNKEMQSLVSVQGIGNENFTLQKLMDITGQNIMTVNNVSRQLGVVASTVTTLVDDVSTIKGDIASLKLNEEVTTTQQETIIETAQRRILEIIGDDPYEKQKYFRIFAKKIYADARHNAGLGSKVSRTKKGSFQRVVDYMEAWIPSCGCAALRAKADNNAEARKLARQEGYLN